MDLNKKRHRKRTIRAHVWGALTTLSMMVSQADEISFARDILPILSDNCFYCHGPDANHREGDLRLDQKEDALASRDGKAAIQPGNPEESLVVQRLRTQDPDDLMPPPDSNKALTEEEIDKLEQWITSGADWGRHWSFEPPVRPPCPLTPGILSMHSSNVDCNGKDTHSPSHRRGTLC